MNGLHLVNYLNLVNLGKPLFSFNYTDYYFFLISEFDKLLLFELLTVLFTVFLFLYFIEFLNWVLDHLGIFEFVSYNVARIFGAKLLLYTCILAFNERFALFWFPILG